MIYHRPFYFLEQSLVNWPSFKSQQIRSYRLGWIKMINIKSISIGLVLILTGSFFTWQYSSEKIDIENNYKKNFIRDEFAKKKIEIEKLFSLTYQTLRTVSLLPSMREMAKQNRQNENENIISSARFTKEGALTVQQLYNNLASNVSVSEIYAVMAPFDPAKSEIPFFMYDELIISEKADAEKKEEEKNQDTPEESEAEEYAYFVKMLDSFKSNHSEFNPENGLDSIPALLSAKMRTCDNVQYPSISKGNAINADGYVYSVPIYDMQNKFKGAVVAVLRHNVLEAATLGVPLIPITEDDNKLFSKNNWNFPDKSGHFILVNKTSGQVIGDRRLALADADIKKMIEAKINNQDSSLHAEELQIKDSSPWTLVYDFSSQPWSGEAAEAFSRYVLKMLVLIVIFSGAFAFYFFQKRKIRLVLSQIFSQLGDVGKELKIAGHKAQENGKDLSQTVQSLASVTTELASAVVQIESQAKINNDLSTSSNESAEVMSKQVLACQELSEETRKSMQLLFDSNSRVSQLADFIREVIKRTDQIEQIVFKTKILSFNASIEAARAGEHGRGFTVVSEEVKLLADATEQVANDISKIIMDGFNQAQEIATINSERVREGTASAENLSQLMKKMKQISSELSEAMTNVTYSTEQQMAGITQVSKTIAEIDKAMGKNRLLAEQSIGLSSHLSQLTINQEEAIEKMNSSFAA